MTINVPDIITVYSYKLAITQSSPLSLKKKEKKKGVTSISLQTLEIN